MADYVAYFNGEFMPFSQVKIDPMDRGFLVGDCVFDVARTFNGKSFRMREHVDRLYRSLRYVRIDPGLTPDELERISEEVVSRNEHLRGDVGDYQLWQFVTRGRGRWAHKAGPPAVGICTRQMGFVRYAHLYDSGAHGVVVRTRSFNPDALDPKVKNFSRVAVLLYTTVRPPSTGSAMPVMKPASSEARNSIALATSSGVPARPRGHTSFQAEIVASMSYIPRVMGVSMKPGHTQFTRIPWRAPSTAAICVSWRMPAFDAE